MLARARAPRLLVRQTTRLLSSSPAQWTADTGVSSAPPTAAVFSDATFAGGGLAATAEASGSALATATAITTDSGVTEAMVLGFWPPDLALRGVEHLHSLGLPWWAAIAGSTLLVRSALMPIALRTTRMQAKLQGLRKDIAPLQARFQASGGTDMEAAEEMQALYNRHGVSPLGMIVPTFMQLPIFFSFFIGLRRLVDAFPDAHQGGALWFADLGASDSTYALPAISSLSALALVRLSMPAPAAGTSPVELEMHSRMQLLMTGLTLISFPVAVTMPSSVLVFWVTNNTFSLMYSSTVLSAAGRAALGLPPLPAVADVTAGAASVMGVAGVADASQEPLPAAFTPPPASRSESLQRAQVAASASLAQLGDALYDSGKLMQAADMHRRAHTQCAEVLGESHPDSLARLWRLAEVSEGAGEHAAAAEALRQWVRHAPSLESLPDGVAAPGTDSVEERISQLDARSKGVE